jgi:hypothetical protein
MLYNPKKAILFIIKNGEMHYTIFQKRKILCRSLNSGQNFKNHVTLVMITAGDS